MGLNEVIKISSWFQRKASQRQKKNKIEGIMIESNSQIEDEKVVDQTFISYFSNIFSSSNPCADLDGVLGKVHNILLMII